VKAPVGSSGSNTLAKAITFDPNEQETATAKARWAVTLQGALADAQARR
jgi:hypothetical protein